MSVDKIAKEEFDKIRIESLEQLSTDLINLLKFNKTYMAEYKTHRIIHYYDEEGVITYKKEQRDR